MPVRAALPAALALVISAALAPPAAAASWEWPVRGEVITPYRNGDDPYAGGQHRGIDIASPVGARVVAAQAGTVRFAGVAGSSGVTVSIRTADGAFDTSYLHLSSLSVREGTTVRAGEHVGAVGTSGRRSAAQPHLHFGVREAGSRHAYRDPLGLLPAPPAPVREAPRGAPAPIGAPVRVAPAPEPVRRSAPARSRRRVPAHRRVRVPTRPRVPMPARPRAPALAPQSAPRPVRAPRAMPAGRGEPAGEHVPAAGPGPLPHAPPANSPSNGLPARPSSGGGLDIGWALACAGLLLAAACIGGRPASPGRGPRPSLRAFLRPLTGRQ